jgi:hypothetical protein
LARYGDEAVLIALFAFRKIAWALVVPRSLLHFPIGWLIFALSKNGQEVKAAILAAAATLIVSYFVEKIDGSTR